MNEVQLQQVIETINEDPNNITIVDNNGNTIQKMTNQRTVQVAE